MCAIAITKHHLSTCQKGTRLFAIQCLGLVTFDFSGGQKHDCVLIRGDFWAESDLIQNDQTLSNKISYHLKLGVNLLQYRSP